MAVWVGWLILAAALGIAEVFTVSAALGLLGGAALLTAGVAVVGLPVPLQLLVFASASAAGLVVLRPIVARRMAVGPRTPFGVEALIGRPAVVLLDVTGLAGTVRIGGEDWSARALDHTAVIPAGTAVDVIQIDGVTAVVHPRE